MRESEQVCESRCSKSRATADSDQVAMVEAMEAAGVVSEAGSNGNAAVQAKAASPHSAAPGSESDSDVEW